MKHYLIAGIAGTLAGVLVTTQLAGPLIAQESGRNASVYQELDLFGSVFERVRRDYVEQVDDKTLIEAAINGMLTSLDPHSSFLSSSDYEDMQTQTRGSFGGLGIEVGQEDGLVKVISPIDDTPAAEAGVQAGDYISHVDGESLMGLSLDQAVEKMRGPVGSEITITILREGESEPFDITIMRDTIKLQVVKTRTEGDTIVLRVSTFNDETYSTLQTQMDQAIEEAGGIDEVEGFVLDLRNNPGGLLDQAVLVSDAFLDAGEITSTRGRNPEDSERWNAEPGDLAQGKPMVVLINGGSASASEIVTGALQDHRRAIVVGTKSFGKGSVQTVMPVTSDSAIRLTTARYYTPSGRSIQALGINPDIIVQQPPARPQEDEDDKPRSASNFNTSESDLRGALNNDSISDEMKQQIEEEAKQVEATAKLREEDYQLAYAIDILKGLAAVNYRASEVPAAAKPAVTGEDATTGEPVPDAVDNQTDAAPGQNPGAPVARPANHPVPRP
ncbi:S41 family peptidase [Paracoccus sp. Z118]|uniref:S41 family peptidase n=1 Tax=Paracoccus sp. Z118 TaxID=2851017 RepID=UPI001C2CA7A4|nr:S41 family peptidase [Paracoccus sp. Z118]MBV0890267.1 S41 family peptidase [Paracoccus sp. Z118]